MGKPESLWKNFSRYGILMKGTTNRSASQRTQVRWIDGSYLMIYAYKTQDIASCKTLSLMSPNGSFPALFLVDTSKPVATPLCIRIRLRK